MRTLLVVALLAAGVTSLSYGDEGTPSTGHENGEGAQGRVLKVFDGKGKIVGPLTSSGSTDGVVLTVSGIATFVAISRPANATTGQYPASQYVWTDIGGQYPTTDCSGPTVISGLPAAPPEILRPSIVLRQGASATLFIAPDAPTTTVTIQSASSDGACQTYGTNPSVPPVFTENAWRVEKTYSLTQNYPEPLTIHY
ncbi:hypothetical protein [Paraburkholderia sp.]|jgi:hypothetical protein|uniref:hypothetical protein n=1 Tax=Paraburkholderia sp. TaxID=1926495 RepID=UPI003C6864B9